MPGRFFLPNASDSRSPELLIHRPCTLDAYVIAIFGIVRASGSVQIARYDEALNLTLTGANLSPTVGVKSQDQGSARRIE